MATTTLKIQEEDKLVTLMFMTRPHTKEGFLAVDIFVADENNMPIGKPSFGYAPGTEEEYHRKLRKDSYDRHNYTKDTAANSTDPEWNPWYVEDNGQFQGDMYQ